MALGILGKEAEDAALTTTSLREIVGFDVRMSAEVRDRMICGAEKNVALELLSPCCHNDPTSPNATFLGQLWVSVLRNSMMSGRCQRGVVCPLVPMSHFSNALAFASKSISA
jgi:hypothetical protein